MPDVAVASKVTSPEPITRSTMAGKAMVCSFFGAARTWKLCDTVEAASHSASPDWSAVMVQVPTAISEAVSPDTEHTAGSSTCS